MSKSQSKTSPTRAEGIIMPRQPRIRRTRSTASPAVVENFVQDDFVLSPMRRRSMLSDDTDIKAPRRASWWKKVEGSARDVLEALDTNKMTDEFLVEEYEFEVEKGKQNQSVPESSDIESLASIVVPQRRLFNQEKHPQSKFADIMGSRKSLGTTNVDDQSIEDAPKNLFNKGPRSKPVFPAALLNSTNKTINKTVEPELNKKARPNLFGQAGTKRKNMFADLVLSDSEEDSEIQHKLFCFKKNNNKRTSLDTRNRRMPSLTPSMTTEPDIDDWYLLPSSTMIGTQEVSKMSIDDVAVPVQEENQDDTLTEANESLHSEAKKQSTHKNSLIHLYENDQTLTTENIEDDSKNQDIKVNESKTNNKTHERTSKLNLSVKDKTLRNKSTTRGNAENEEIIEEAIVEKQQNNAATKKQITVMKEQSLEDTIAELHEESVDKEESQQNILLNITKENVEIYKDTETENKGEQEIRPSAEQQELQNVSKVASNVNQNEVDDDLPENVIFSGKQLERTRNYEAQKRQTVTQDEDMDDACEKDKSGSQIELSIGKHESQAHSPGEARNTNQDEDMENEREKEIEPSCEEQETHDHSEEGSQTNQDEVMNDISENDESEEESELSDHDEENQDDSKEESHEKEDEEMDDVSEKDKSEEIEPRVNDQVIHNDSKEKKYENEEEDMEEMVWNDNDMNDDEKASDTSEATINAKGKQNDEVAPGEKDNKTVEKDRTLERKNINKSRNLTNKSQRTLESLVDNDQIEEDVVDETPNNSTHDTTGRNRKKETIVKSPEAVPLNNVTYNESFRPIGRSTSFRKSKSLYDSMNRRSVAPVQESSLGGEGSGSSSTEGSEWDSHRTTRKTIRQTLGKEYTTRKSLRALVMEQSAKRQTELYSKNTSNINKTKNKSVLERNDKNASKLNKTKNKTVLDEANKTATVDKTNNKTVFEDVNNKNASTMNNTKNNTVLEDINDQHIRFVRTSNSVLSGSMQLKSPILKSPVDGTSSHHVLDSLISEHQVSDSKSLHDINVAEISEQISNREVSINIPVVENNDSGPEISMNVSYGQGMSADTAHEASLEDTKASDEEIKENSSLKRMEDMEIPRRNASVRAQSIHSSDQEVLDYEPSELEKSEQDISDNEVNQENVEQDDSVQDEEKENSEPEESENEEAVESELENEDSQQEIEVESEHGSQQDIDAESDHEESEQGIESEQEESQQEIESESDQKEFQQHMESEQEFEESQQEIEAEFEHESQQEIEESENEASQQQMESEQDESQQEIEPESDQEESQQDIESEQEEPQQEIELESEQESDNEERDCSQPESDQEIEELSREPEKDSEEENEDLDSQYHTTNSRVSRVVLDTQNMSDEEIEFEGVSRQTENDSSEQSERELSRNILPQVSQPIVHNSSVATKRSILRMQIQKAVQKREEQKEKIRKYLEKELLKPVPRGCSSPDYSMPRKIKEPRQPKKKPNRTGFPMEMLPKAFVEDLMYKPPKRFMPAPWTTKRLYKFIETKLEPKYDYRARVRAEELVRTIYSFSKLVRRCDVAPPQAVAELKREMARLNVVETHFDFYEFMYDYLPREVRIKVIPNVANKIPMPRNGIYGEILQSREVAE